MIYDTSQELQVNKLLSRLDALLSKKCIIVTIAPLRGSLTK